MDVPLDRKTRVERDKTNMGLFAGQEGLKTSLKEATKDRTYLEKALKKYGSIFFFALLPLAGFTICFST